MRQGTTPIYTLTIPSYDLTDKTVFVAIGGRGPRVIKTGDALNVIYDGEASTIAFGLTQEETLSQGLGRAEIQVRFIDENGVAKATDIKPIMVERVLQPGGIEYEGGD